MDVKIIVALIAAFVSFIGLLISKEQKVSEFRQAWIDRVRNDVAELIGKCSEIGHNWIMVQDEYRKNKKVGDKFLKDNLETFKDIDLTISRIKLSLNPDDDNEMLKALEAVEDATNSPSKIKNLSDAVNNIESLSHKVFKTEWERVKSGEPIFRASKWLVGLLIPALLIFAVCTKI